jgi:predicted Fe-Mo cluster-binding NifX family protein
MSAWVALIDALQAGLSHFDTASHFCVVAVEDNDANEVRHTSEFISSADGHLRIATAIRDRIVNGTT